MFKVGDWVSRSNKFGNNWPLEFAGCPVRVQRVEKVFNGLECIWFAERGLKRDAGWVANRFTLCGMPKKDYDEALKGLL